MSLTNVTVSPRPVKAGKNFSLNLDLENSVELDSGTFVTQVFLAGVQVHSESDPLCTIRSCPIPTGSVRLGTTTFMPLITPPGLYQVKITGVDDEGLPILCADVHFTVIDRRHLTTRLCAAP
eukprot:CAMPEP_0113662110 /NCGR_PEP_ID=MMETSP0038_2-20120614/380_1 /TAXON_ID=2898 /ORGANISM="Cryptomonas paramecium" /LENGTH=121 /DNA_ID=CAMNT_0000576941 /DNA_START=126 /DNA_END=488 /DNA_ORIENTATION=+ /assembly_acc=CAM_ASM_000170